MRDAELALINQIQPPLAAHELPIHASVQLWILCSLKKLHLPSSNGRNVEYSTGGEKHSVGCRERKRREDWSDKNTQPWYRKDQIRGREGDGRWLIQQKWRQRRINDECHRLIQRGAEKYEGRTNYLVRFVSLSISPFPLPSSFPCSSAMNSNSWMKPRLQRSVRLKLYNDESE